MIDITFLKSAENIPLRKTYSPDGDKAYPNVASFTSETVQIQPTAGGLQAFYKHLEDYGSRGWAMLKGKAKYDIKKQTRKGLTDKFEQTQHIVLDIDGFELDGYDPTHNTPITQDFVKNVAEQIINLLPKAFKHVSYIVGVSSSFGRKPTINLHFHFLLTKPISPAALADWFKALNFALPAVENQLQLSASKKFLKYIIDPVVARNGQIIYIAPPEYDRTPDPVLPDARLVLVEKQFPTIELGPLVAEADPEVVREATNNKIRKLYKKLGFRYKAPKYVTIQSAGASEQVLSNPGRMRIEYAYTDGKYARFNINNGDSNAYWIYLDNPRIMYSFKGDDPFDFSVAAPDTYQWVLENLCGHKAVPSIYEYTVVHDIDRDTYAKVIYNKNTNQLVDFFTSKKDSLDDWMKSHNKLMPDPIEPFKIDFDPKGSAIQVDIANRYINRFTPSRYLSAPPTFDPAVEFQNPLEYGYAYQLHQKCPFIYNIINHMIGGEPVTFEHFINWLAFVVKEREKAQTAWLIQGTTGTGKGLFFKKIMHPLLTEGSSPDLVLMKRMVDLDDQFNGYMESCLFMMVDEFRMGDSKKTQAIENMLKNQITEPLGTIRGMRQNPVQRRLYTNFIFSTNDNDSLIIASNDRRYNVAERQNVKLAVAFPNIDDKNADGKIEAELADFATFLKLFKYDIKAVRRPLENRAKQRMREASADILSLFISHLENGDLVHFTDVLYDQPKSAIEEKLYESVKRTIIKWVAYANNRSVFADRNELRHVLEYFSNREIPRNRFSKIMAGSRFPEERVKMQSKIARGFHFDFIMDQEERALILSRMASETERELFARDGIDLSDLEDVAHRAQSVRFTPPQQLIDRVTEATKEIKKAPSDD